MSYNLGIDPDYVINTYYHKFTTRDIKKLRHAVCYAAKKHAGQKRYSGEPYIIHPVRVSRNASKFGLGIDEIISSILHDVVEDCNTSLEEIENEFGKTVAETVDALTKLNETDFSGHIPDKTQIKLLSDIRLLKKATGSAILIKAADRIDNLQTIDAVKKEKRIIKTIHTREMIIPLLKHIKAFSLVDTLEELCFIIEHDDINRVIEKNIKKIKKKHGCDFSNAFKTLQSVLTSSCDEKNLLKDRHYLDYIKGVHFDERSHISIFRELVHYCNNIKMDCDEFFKNNSLSLHNITLIVNDSPYDSGSSIRSCNSFMYFLDHLLSDNGFRITRVCSTTYRDSEYFIIADEKNNLYRLFIKTERDYHRYLYGNISDYKNKIQFSDVNEFDPRDTYNEKIKIFKEDGSAMFIDKGATVMDFAFYLHSDIGLHFSYAMIDGSKTRLPAYTKLNYGDTIIVVSDDKITPEFSWIKYVKTDRAKHQLAAFFQDKYDNHKEKDST